LSICNYNCLPFNAFCLHLANKTTVSSMCVASACSYLLRIVVYAMNSCSQLFHRYTTSYHHKGLQILYARTNIFGIFVAAIHSRLFLNLRQLFEISLRTFRSNFIHDRFIMIVIIDINVLSICSRAFHIFLRLKITFTSLSYAVKFIMTNYIQFESFFIIIISIDSYLGSYLIYR